MSTATSSHTNDPLASTTVAGRYVIEAPIGAGAMGAVYRAHQRGLDRPVALKVLRRDLSWGGDTVARFRREAKAMSALTHPNTVRVFDFGATKDGWLFLAMELLHGKLCTQLVKEGAVSPEQAVRYTQQVLRSIGEAHSKGIIHRDLKPDNIFIADVDGHDEPIVKVLDFGIAKAIQGEQTLDQFETQDGTVFGTPRYMSPEQAQGKPLDRRSDLYAVGIMLYELLTGAPPFVDHDAVIVMAQHIRETPARMMCPHEGLTFSRKLTAIVDKALAKDPEQRFQTAREFETALESCVRAGRLVDRDRSSGLAASRAYGEAAVSALLGLRPRSRWLAAAALCAGLGGVAYQLAPGEGQGVTALSTGEAQSRGVVRLETEPRGAEVFRGGSRIGQTPLDVLIEPGLPSKIRLKKRGFVDLSVQLQASDGQRRLTMARVPTVSSGSVEAPKARRLTMAQKAKQRKLREKRRRMRAKAAAKASANKPAAAASARAQRRAADDASPYEKF